jgi:hypothetical protein
MITKQARQRAANMMAQRQGIPTTQAAIDAEWRGIVAKLNATLRTQEPIRAGRTSPAAGSAKPTQGDIDAGWALVVSKLNAESGLAPPARAR